MSKPELEEASNISQYRGSSSKLSRKPSPLILPVSSTSPSSPNEYSSTQQLANSPNSPLRRSTAFYGKGKEKRRQSFVDGSSSASPVSLSSAQEHTLLSSKQLDSSTPRTKDTSLRSKVEYSEVLNEISHPSRVPGFSNTLVDYFEIDPLLLRTKQPQSRLTSNKKKRTFSGTSVKSYPQVRSISGGNATSSDPTKANQNTHLSRTLLSSLHLQDLPDSSKNANYFIPSYAPERPEKVERSNTLNSKKSSNSIENAHVEFSIKTRSSIPNIEELSFATRSKARISENYDILRERELESDNSVRPQSSLNEVPPFTPTFGPVRDSYYSDPNDRMTSYRVSRVSNRSSLPRHPFRDTFGFDKQLLNSGGKAHPLRKSVLKGDLDIVDSEFTSYPQRVSSLQNLHKELTKERLSLLGEINELKRISRYESDVQDDEFIQKIQHAEDRIETFEHLIEQAERSIQSSPNHSPESGRTKHAGGKGFRGNNQAVHAYHQANTSSILSNESIDVDLYIPYTVPQNRISLPNYAHSRIQPLMLDDTPVFKSSLYKLGSNRQWQKREFRIDGFMLVCLEKKKIKVEPKTVILAKYSAPSGLQSDPELRKHFYPTSPPLPHISHPLVATASSVNSDIGVDQYVEYYQPPKWVIPLSDILAVTLLARNGFKVRKCFAIHTSERKYILRAPTEMETACWVYLLKRMAINRYREINLLEYSSEAPSDQPDSLVHINPTNSKNPPLHHKRVEREEVLDEWRSTVNELVRREPSLQHSLRANTPLSLSPPNRNRLQNKTSNNSSLRSGQLSRGHTSSPTDGMPRRKPLPTPPARTNSSPIINPLRIINQSEA